LSYAPVDPSAISPRGAGCGGAPAGSTSEARSGWDRSSCSCAWCTSAPCTRCRRAEQSAGSRLLLPSGYSTMLTIAPAPTVRPPSRIAKRCPISIAIGVMSSTFISTLSPGMIISAPSGRPIAPVTSVVRR